MRTGLLIVAMLALPAAGRADDWTATDTALELTFAAVTSIDLVQTSWVVKHPTLAYERNVLLGRHPSQAQLNLAVASAILGHVVVSRVLPQPWRRGWQYVSLAWETSVVGRNFITLRRFAISVPW